MNIKRTLMIAGLISSSIFNSVYGDGARNFKANCNMCHAPDGSSTALGKTFKARNLAKDPFKMGESKEEIAETIRKGLGVMKGYANLSKTVRLELADYILGLRGKNITIPKKEVKFAKPVVVKPKSAAKEAPANPVVKKEKVETARTVVVPKPVVSQSVIKVPKEEIAKVKKPLEQKTPKVDYDIERAKKVYKKHCALCHGPKGKAQSPTGVAMKARDFTKDVFKKGETEENILNTITNGLGDGSLMVGFPHISKEDRVLLTKLVKSLKGGPGIVNTKPKTPQNIGNEKISITYAMQLLEEKPRTVIKRDFNDNSKGWKLYQDNCASCHGDNGQGGLSTIMVSAAPMTRLKTEALLGYEGYWLDKKKFTKLVTEGLSGGLMPGNGTLTKSELNDLFQFFVDSVSEK